MKSKQFDSVNVNLSPLLDFHDGNATSLKKDALLDLIETRKEDQIMLHILTNISFVADR